MSDPIYKDPSHYMKIAVKKHFPTATLTSNGYLYTVKVGETILGVERSTPERAWRSAFEHVSNM